MQSREVTLARSRLNNTVRHDINMKNTIIILLSSIVVLTSYSEEISPSALITKIIKDSHSFGYNPVDKSEDELIKADAINSDLRLREIILNSTDEELITCYALSIVNANIERISAMQKNNTPTNMHIPSVLEGLSEQRKLLVKHLRKIQK